MKSVNELDVFKDAVWSYYNLYARELPWRKVDDKQEFDPYKILVSELMLQQTQVDRVRPKYTEFIQKFPDINSLAKAPLNEVLRSWSGLGYNRRAKYLHEFALGQQLSDVFPNSVNELQKHRGIGPNTAAAVLVYSYNKPLVFIETNIRTVYLHHFFKDKTQVTDKEILSVVEQTLDENNPREWYWALMDYGSFLKKNGIKNLGKSKSHKKQSKFSGSDRELRGRILKELLKSDAITFSELNKLLNDSRLDKIIASLEKEKMITNLNGLISLP
jgi:A/G-specific adenine glycosylase